jgi:arylsulfatase A-like enzyme
MVRDGDWKYIRHRFDPCDELYDLQHDPGEMANLAGDSAQTERVVALGERIRGMLDSHGAGPYAWAATQ